MGYRVANATINSRGHSIAYGIDHGLMDAHCCGSLYNTLGIYNNESGCHLLGSWLVVDLNTHMYHHRFGSFFLAYIAFMCVRARSAEKYDASKD